MNSTHSSTDVVLVSFRKYSTQGEEFCQKLIHHNEIFAETNTVQEVAKTVIFPVILRNVSREKRQEKEEDELLADILFRCAIILGTIILLGVIILTFYTAIYHA